MIPSRAANHASFSLKEDETEAESEVSLVDRELRFIQGRVTNHDPAKPAEFDVVLRDAAGVEQKRVHFKTGESERFGQAAELQTADDRYTIRVENVRGAKTIDVFLD